MYMIEGLKGLGHKISFTLFCVSKVALNILSCTWESVVVQHFGGNVRA